MSNIIQTQKRPDAFAGRGSVEDRLLALENWQRVTNAWLDVQQRRVAWGLWTPTATNTANLDASTMYQNLFIVVDGGVFCAGRFDADATAAAPTATTMRMTLPVPATITEVTYLAGVAVCESSGQTTSARINGNVANNAAALSWSATTTSNAPWYFMFAYRLS